MFTEEEKEFLHAPDLEQVKEFIGNTFRTKGQVAPTPTPTPTPHLTSTPSPHTLLCTLLTYAPLPHSPHTLSSPRPWTRLREMPKCITVLSNSFGFVTIPIPFGRSISRYRVVSTRSPKGLLSSLFPPEPHMLQT